MRRIAWYSCGAASAVAVKLSNPDVIAYCETGSEDEDNKRFMADCEEWFGKEITILRNPKYETTWDVWEKRQYLSGHEGAPCTGELKINPRLEFEEPDDVHVFGYTADSADVGRAERLQEHWPDLNIEIPLIDRGITKASCLGMIKGANIDPPRTYEMGYPNANCIPCVKATSPDYWSLVRKKHPKEFKRMVKLSKRLGARLTRIDSKRIFLHEIPRDWPTTDPIAPECDFLCALAEQEIYG